MAMLYRRIVGSPISSNVPNGYEYTGRPNAFGVGEYITGTTSSGIRTIAPNPYYDQLASGQITANRIFVTDTGGSRVSSNSLPQRSAPLSGQSAVNASLGVNSRPTASSINSFLGTYASFDGPFANTKVNLGGQVTKRSLAEKAGGIGGFYDTLVPNSYSNYLSGKITGSTLFNQAMKAAVRDDKDVINNSSFHVSAPPRVSFSFSGSGGGRISFSGGGFSF